MTDEFANWQSEWQSLGGREELARELTARAANDAQRLRTGVVKEVLAAVFAVVLCVWLMARSHGEMVTLVACGGVLAFMGVWLTRLFTLREGMLSASTTGLDAFVELTRKRLESDIRWSAFSLRATAVLGALVVPWAVWAFVARYAMYRAEPWRAFVGFGGALAIFIALVISSRRKRVALMQERDQFEKLVSDRRLDS